MSNVDVPKMKTYTLRVNINNNECEALVYTILEDLHGVFKVYVDSGQNTASVLVTVSGQNVDPNILVRKLSENGITASILETPASEGKDKGKGKGKGGSSGSGSGSRGDHGGGGKSVA